MSTSYRRSSSDKEWQRIKKIVKERDNNSCRIPKCISLQEYIYLKKNSGHYLSIIDPAHIISVSENPSIMYEPSNIISLNRYSHENLDLSRDPIHGKPISKEEVTKWWVKLLKANPNQYREFLDMLKRNNISYEMYL